MSDKKKYYLRGLSIGMIFTCIILMILFKNNPPELSDKQFKELAEKKGYVLKSETDAKPSPSINLEELKKTPEPKPSPSAEPTPTKDLTPTAEATPTETPTPTVEATPTSAPTPEPTPTLAPTPTPTATEAPTPTVTPLPTLGPETTELTEATIVVNFGEISEFVVHKLYLAKIIKNEADFNYYLYLNDAGRYFQPGTYVVNDKMSYKDLVYLLTNGNKRLED